MLGVASLTDTLESAHSVALFVDVAYKDEFIGSTVSVVTEKGFLGYLNTLFTACEVYRGQVLAK